MHEFLVDLGFGKYDVALLILCPLGATLGSFAHAILLISNPQKIPRPGDVRFNSNMEAMVRAIWLAFRLTLGAILGLVVGLYFVGALQENVATLAKIVALSILIGYAAPKLWVAHEKILVEELLKRFKDVLDEQSSKKTSNA